MKKKKLSKGRISDEVSITKTTKFSKKNIGFIVVIGIVLIMIISIFTLGLGSNNGAVEKTEYNGFELINRDGIWVVNANGLDYGFEYDPRDLEMIKIVNLTDTSFSNKVYLLFNPEEFSENSLELTRLKQFLSSRGMVVSLACIEEESCGNIPIVDCSNINKPVYLRNGNRTEIYKEDNCIVLEAVNGEEPLVINKFMYWILGIVQ